MLKSKPEAEIYLGVQSTCPTHSVPFLQVIAAEGEQKASRALREASEVISESPSALQVSLRARFREVRWGHCANQGEARPSCIAVITFRSRSLGRETRSVLTFLRVRTGMSK